MATLNINDFKQENPLSLSAILAGQPKGNTVNDRSAAMLAGSQALMIDPTKSGYEGIKAELLDPETARNYVARDQEIQTTVLRDSSNSLLSMIGDSAVTEEDKLKAYVGAQNLDKPTSLPERTADLVAEQAIIADSGEESPRASETRSLGYQMIRDVNRQKQKMTAMINSLEIGKDANTADRAVDVAETLVPFSEWLYYDRIDNSMPDNTGAWDEAFLMGNKKAALKEYVRSLPVDSRAAFLEYMINVVQDSNVILPDGNDLKKLQVLQDMFLEGDYSDFDRYFDNTVAVLDLTGLGGLVSKSFKATTKGAKAIEEVGRVTGDTVNVGERLSAEARAFKPEVAPTDPTLQAEANAFKPSPEPTAQSVFGPKPTFDAAAAEDKLAAEARAFVPSVDDESALALEAKAWATRTDVVPSSPSQIIKDANPEMARSIHVAMSEDNTGETAKAFYGSTREEALAKDILPEPQTTKGAIPNKVEMRPHFEEPQSIRAQRLNEGNTILTEGERAAITDRLTEGMRNVEGMNLHPSSLVVRAADDGTIEFTGRFSPPDSGFLSPQTAIDNAKFAFRNYGMTEDNFSILARRGDKWVEATTDELNAEAALIKAGAPLKSPSEYAIGMKYNYRFNPNDLQTVDNLTTAPGLVTRMIQGLDRIPTQWLASHGQGSIVQHLLDAASVIHPKIVNAASVVFDKTFGLRKAYVDQFAEFTKVYKNLSRERRAIMTDYIHQANSEGIAFSRTDLVARGFNEKEIKALEVWRRANDIMWYANNEDMVKTLKALGTKVFIHSGSDTKLMGVPMSRGALNGSVEALDFSGKIPTTTLDKAALDELYTKGGSIVKLHEPVEIDGKLIDRVMVPNSTTGGYTRELYEGETVMAYRDGYYPVSYDANFFIEKSVRSTSGEVYKRTIASARTTEEVKQALKGIQESEKLTNEEMNALYTYRKDRRLAGASNSLFDEGSWRVATNSGITAQKARGVRLMDAGADLHRMGHAHLKDPLEAITGQIHQLAKRTSVRTFIETYKKRFMLQYGKYLDLPTTASGDLRVPRSISEVRGRAGVPGKIIADARTNYNYISSLENGYINGIDAGFKALLHGAADLMGEIGMSSLEKVFFNGMKKSPVSTLKAMPFKLFIAGHPIRQALVQRFGQMAQLGSINPKYVLKGEMVKDLWGINAVRIGISKDPKYVALYEEIKRAGILEAVDANTLLHEDMLRLADLSFGEKVKSTVSAPVKYLQKIGFDLAEQDVLLSAWLSERDLAIKAGKNVNNITTQEEILGQMRAVTANMNRAGEMPYSQNTLGLVAQFFAYPHKALLQGLTNRSLSPVQRAKLIAYNTALFGIQSTPIYFAVDWAFGSTEPNALKDKIKAGLLDTTLNAALTAVSGESQMIDFGDLAPANASGVGNVFLSMLDTPILEALTNSPSTGMFFGNSPRIKDAFTTAAKWFLPFEDYEDPALETKYTDVVLAAANMFSGFSDAWKAHYAFETGKKLSGSGRVVDEDITKIEALFSAFGFHTKTEKGYQKAFSLINKDGYQTSDSDINDWYTSIKRQFARKNVTVRENEFATRVFAEAWRVFSQDRPKAVASLLSKIQNDAKNGDYVMVNGILRQMGFMTDSEIWQIVNALPAGAPRENLTNLLKTREEILNAD